MMTPHPWPNRGSLRSAWVLAFLLGAGPLAAATYEVGPGQTLASPGEVPWESLAAGDIVLIHWRATPYTNKWVICRQGTAEAPITVRGVPGPGGELPVIDGHGATTRSSLNYWNQPRGLLKIGGANVPPDTTPRFITIENLDLRSARPPFTFSAADGSTQAYPNNAASLYVEKGERLTIRNCILHDSGNGLFVAYQARDVLVEGCHLFDNGNVGSAYEHNSYTAAQGITFQYNRYGPLRAGCNGNNLKDRSAGLVVRYNWIESGNRQLDLVDGEDSPVIQTNAFYRKTYVYGNVLIEPDGAGNSQIVHYGGDSGDPTIYRKGTLHFFQNTIVSTRSGNTTLFRLSTDDEHCDARNNLIYVTAGGSRLALLDSAGRLNLTHNWLSAGFVSSHSGLTGSITNDGSNLTGAGPGFLDAANQNFRLATNSVCRDAGTGLHPDALSDQAVLREYRRHRTSERRLPYQAPDLGAFEFSPYEAWRFGHFGPDLDNLLISGDWVDPDGDGVPNLFEYAHQLDPRAASRTGLPAPALLGAPGDRHFAIAFTRRVPPSELTYTVQVSPNLLTWNEGSSYSDQGAVLSNSFTADIGASNPTVVQLNAAMAASDREFVRVAAVRDARTP
jgi:hypothetical protein